MKSISRDKAERCVLHLGLTMVCCAMLIRQVAPLVALVLCENLSSTACHCGDCARAHKSTQEHTELHKITLCASLAAAKHKQSNACTMGSPEDNFNLWEYASRIRSSKFAEINVCLPSPSTCANWIWIELRTGSWGGVQIVNSHICIGHPTPHYSFWFSTELQD